MRIMDFQKRLQKHKIWTKFSDSYSTLPKLWLAYFLHGTQELVYCQTPDLPILPSLPLIGKSGRLYIRVVGWSVVCHNRESSDVTLAFEDAQVFQTLMDYE